MLTELIRSKNFVVRASHTVTFALIAFVALGNISVADYSPDEWVYSTCGYQLATTTSFCNAGHPPLTKMWFGLWEFFFGDSIRVARVAAGVAAIGTAVVIYLLVRKLLDWRWGLVGAALWGLTSQLGSNGNSSDLVVRISRYAFLEPLLCFFVVFGLYAGWRWSQRESSKWAAFTVAAAVGAALSKELGIIVAPVLLAVPAAVCWRFDRSRFWRDLRAMTAGGVSVVTLTFLTFGPVGGYSNLLSFARYVVRNTGLVGQNIIDGHLYSPPPWWLGFRYAQLGMGTPLVVIVMVGLLCGVAFTKSRFLTLYCLAISLTMILTLIVLRREANFYWIAWEPPLLIAAAAGLGSAYRLIQYRYLALATLAVAAGLMVVTVLHVATLSSGRYHQLASRVHCHQPCVALSIAYQFVPDLYGINAVQSAKGSGGLLVQALSSPVGIPVGTLTSGQKLADYVFIDTDSIAYFDLKFEMPAILRQLHALGYHKIWIEESLSAYAR